MISGSNYKGVEIDIKIYKYKYSTKKMNRDIDRRCCKNNPNRFICSICLNKNSIIDDNRNIECCKRKSKSCPICDKSFDGEIQNNDCITKFGQNKDYHTEKSSHNKKDLNGKNIQTSQTDVTQGLSLLNEVLTVFQSKKQCEIKNSKSSKTVILKDANVGTDDIKKGKPNLNLSKVFYFSIQDNNEMLDSKFVIVNQQPETTKASQFSMDLVKHKSSSIPQMKLDELKNSLKEKTKSKDAIEEVNRMFATVRKCEINEMSEASNRPITRSGPRILPVVKTTNAVDESNKTVQNCRFCQSNYRLSSGDSSECCHRTNERCDECFYMMCCHYQHRRNCGAKCPNCNKEREDNKKM